MASSREARRTRRLAVVFGALFILCIVTFVILEVALRLIVEPSDRSFGRIFGKELPPIQLVRSAKPPSEDPYRSPQILPDGRQVTVGDINGIWRGHPQIGYLQRFNTRSANGWWRSNNVGARANEPADKDPEAGVERVLVFGDSYAMGWGVPQDSIWTSVMEQMAPDLEVLNFGVSGYSTALAYLRYQEVRPLLNYDTVVLTIAPGVDFWRDINVIRDTAVFWDAPEPLPRAVLEKDALRFVPSPYTDSESFYSENYPVLSQRLIDHLERYDRHYYGPLYDVPPVIGHSLVYKTAVVALDRLRSRSLFNQYRDPGSEATAITRAVIEAFHADVSADGAKLIVLILPIEWELEIQRTSERFARDTKAVSEVLCESLELCVDLSPSIAGLPLDCIDFGADNTHYGPKLNDVLARVTLRQLGRQSVAAAQPTTPCDPYAVRPASEP